MSPTILLMKMRGKFRAVRCNLEMYFWRDSNLDRGNLRSAFRMRRVTAFHSAKSQGFKSRLAPPRSMSLPPRSVSRKHSGHIAMRQRSPQQHVANIKKEHRGTTPHFTTRKPFRRLTVNISPRKYCWGLLPLKAYRIAHNAPTAPASHLESPSPPLPPKLNVESILGPSARQNFSCAVSCC